MNLHAPVTRPCRPRRPRNLAMRLVDALGDRIRDGSLRLRATSCRPSRRSWRSSASAAPWCARRCRSCRPAALVRDAPRRRHLRRRHGGVDSAVFRIGARPDRDRCRRDRRARAAHRPRDRSRRPGRARRTDDNLAAMREALTPSRKPSRRAATRWAPTSSSTWRSRARPEPALLDLLTKPRHGDHSARPARHPSTRRPTSGWPTCAASTASTRASSTRSRTRTPKRRARRCAPTWPTAASGAGARRNWRNS